MKKTTRKSPGLYGRFLNKREAIEVVDPFRLQNYVELNTFFDILQFALTNDYKIINAVSKNSITNLELGLKLAGHNSSVIVRLPETKTKHGFVYRSLYYARRSVDML